ncbi:hypothetical protein IFM89_014223 [Coptis chinensis]|uniref:Uncharacterized protein n=1 Tax=Coptis chinensis TaxID=261450 RepID=A0A835LF21_9MAGN|nr:hypothetical protein IFM89_014223 [Coptis chinensis]
MFEGFISPKDNFTAILALVLKKEKIIRVKVGILENGAVVWVGLSNLMSIGIKYIKQKRGSLIVMTTKVYIDNRGCLGCCTKATPVITVDELSKGLKIQAWTMKKGSISEDFWSTSTCEMNTSAIQSQISVSSINTSNQTLEAHCGLGSTSNPPEFVNHVFLQFLAMGTRVIGMFPLRLGCGQILIGFLVIALALALTHIVRPDRTLALVPVQTEETCFSSISLYASELIELKPTNRKLLEVKKAFGDNPSAMEICF